MTDHSHETDKPETDEITGVDTTGHEWDGIKELNNPLPRWWLYVFYATVVVSAVCWVLLPAWPALPGMGTNTPGIWKQSDRGIVHAEVAEMRSERAEMGQILANSSAEEILANSQHRQFAQALGESFFGDNCATCHGTNGVGGPGYPSLIDDVWLWGGSLEEIEYTIRHGIRSGYAGERTNDMPAFGRDQFLEPAVINDLVDFVIAKSGGDANQIAANRAAPVYEKECSSCHGLDAKGDPEQGAPDLTDHEWLYGSTRSEIRRTIYGPRAGVMPAWEPRLDDATIRSLAVYVRSLGGEQSVETGSLETDRTAN